MKVLVIGGSGFIGSHVADALSDEKHSVTVFDIQPSRHLREEQQFILGDALDREQVATAVDGFDAVYNFAGIPHLDVGLTHPIETVEQNILGTVITLEASRQAGVKRYVYASTIYVYSEGGSFYRCSKQAAELYVEEYSLLHGLDYTILRYGTVYGPRADDNNSVRHYLKQALVARRIVAYGPGDEIRQYIHVEDAARSSVRILSEEFSNEHVVLTGHHPMRLRELLIMIREIVGRDVVIDHRSIDINDPKNSASGHYSITPFSFRPKIAKNLVNNPYLDMGEGLLECLEEIYDDTTAPKEEGG
ncbi:NAD(P)-dependent oxidoreductase [Acidobacteria bacterium AH-259-D05]|nr:NAD(P)-dependent oxidoreductase [Acidobacteria bacterium AH-259-D05]